MSRHPGGRARRALVTGCAGFLGSHLSERLIEDGCEVVGVDAFTPFYARELKEGNLDRLRELPEFELREVDLAEDRLAGLLDGVDVVFHLAGEPGVRQSFGAGAAAYVRNNVRATARLLSEAGLVPHRPFVYASSSTVYGEALRMPTPEESDLQPISPYGRTKVATEALASLAHSRTGLAAIGMRYFSAYGPRQRPDLAFKRFIDRALAGQAVPVNGTGTQRRDFTYVGDIVEATLAAAEHGRAGRVYNIGGGSPASILDAVGMLEELLERPVEIDWRPPMRGDARETCADTHRAERELGFKPQVALAEGLARQVEWTIDRSRALAPAPG